MKKAVIVGSVKGGTGKSLFSTATALSLARRGVRTALIDLDFDSSHVADFLPHRDGGVELLDHRTLRPWKAGGLEVFSMGKLVDRDKSASLRGRDHAQIVGDLVRNTRWESEVAVLDLPAGSSDTFLSTVRVFTPILVGGVVVTQPAFPVDTRRVLDLHRTHGVPCLGLVENMAGFKCGKCQEVHPVFGPGGAGEIAREFGVEAVWSVPLSMEVRSAVEARDPLRSPEVRAVADGIAERVLAASPEKVGLARRLASKAKEMATGMFAEIIGSILTVANREIPLSAWQQGFGLTAAQTVGLVLTNPAGDRTVLSNHFRARDGRLTTVRSPDREDVVIETDYATLAACLLLDSSPAPDKFINAYLAGRMRFYGDGAFPRALFIIRNVFANEAVVRQVNERFGRVLKALASDGEG